MTNDIIKYEHQFEEIRSIITMHREKALRLVNEESLQMSWIVGKIVSDRLKSNEWGSKVVTQLSEYLRTKDPSLKGYSRRNIYNMVTFYEEYSADGFTNSLQRLALPNFVQTETAQMAENEIVQTTSAQLFRRKSFRNLWMSSVILFLKKGKVKNTLNKQKPICYYQ